VKSKENKYSVVMSIPHPQILKSIIIIQIYTLLHVGAAHREQPISSSDCKIIWTKAAVKSPIQTVLKTLSLQICHLGTSCPEKKPENDCYWLQPQRGRVFTH
jgi:hypothetical protein